MRLVALVLLAGCSSGLDRSSFDVNVCTNNRWSELAGVTLADPSLYLEHVFAQPDPQPTRSGSSSVGVRCANATDRAACEAAVAAAAPSGQPWRTENCGGAGCTTTVRFFVEEKAGSVSVVQDLDALRARVAPVDNAAEAALLAVYAVKLDGMECSAPQVRAVAGGYEVFLASGGGECFDREEKRVRVAVDGTATVIESNLRRAEKTCLFP